MTLVSLDELLKIIDQLPPEQKRAVRQYLDDDWSARFQQALGAIHADMPTTLPEDEIAADIEAAIQESRQDSP